MKINRNPIEFSSLIILNRIYNDNKWPDYCIH